MISQKISFSEKYVLLDNEGTMSSFAVSKTFLDYFLRTLREYLNERWHDQELQNIIGMLKKQCQEDICNNIAGVIPIVEGARERESIVCNVTWHTNLARQSTAIAIVRKLQHLVWVHGCATNALKFQVFDDVQPALKLWKNHGKLMFVYSSTTVETQKMIFSENKSGNLYEFFSGNFDLEIGAKTDQFSYLKIADKLGCLTRDILFISDRVSEGNAAKEAGCKVFICVRPGNAPLSEEEKNKFICIRGFDEIAPNALPGL